MKLIRAGRTSFVFGLDRNEKEVLFQVLKLYPLVPASHQRLTRAGDPSTPDENQALLEQALEEKRRENRGHVLALLQEPARFRETKAGFRFTLTPPEINWLLQVLNDVRVGAWLALDEPDEIHLPPLTADNARFVMAMQAAGFFEAHLLSGLGVDHPANYGDA